MSSMAHLAETAPVHAKTWENRILPALLAASLGLALLWAAGFAETPALHNAAHDGRHAAAFPCH